MSQNLLIDHNCIFNSGGQQEILPAIKKIDDEILRQMEIEESNQNKYLTESIAVGDNDFVEDYKSSLKSRGATRTIKSEKSVDTLIEPKKNMVLTIIL